MDEKLKIITLNLLTEFNKESYVVNLGQKKSGEVFSEEQLKNKKFKV